MERPSSQSLVWILFGSHILLGTEVFPEENVPEYILEDFHTQF